MVADNSSDKSKIMSNIVQQNTGLPENPPTNLPVPDSTAPPLLIESTLHLAWGLTLYLSTSDKQGQLAQAINQNVMASFTTTNLGDTDKRFVNNLVTMIASYLRRMGFEKDVYDGYLQSEKDKLQRKTEYWKNMGAMISFSGDSAIVKIASFFGVGAAGKTLMDFLNTKNIPSDGVSKSSNIVANYSLHGVVNNTPNATNTMSNSSGFTADWIGGILIGGTIGLLITIALLSWISNKMTDRAEKKVNKNQDEYWQHKMRERYKEELKILYDDIVYLIKYYYPKYDNDPLLNPQSSNHEPHKSFEGVVDEILPTKRQMYSLRPPHLEKMKN